MDIHFDGNIVDGGYKLEADGAVVTLSNLNTSGTFSLAGSMLANCNNCYPHIRDNIEKFNIFFDFQEGFSQLSIGGELVMDWVFGPRYGTPDWQEPTTFDTWHTWSLTYDGVSYWTLNINGTDLPVLNIYNRNAFAGIDYDLTISNYSTFGSGYVLIKDLTLS